MGSLSAYAEQIGAEQIGAEQIGAEQIGAEQIGIVLEGRRAATSLAALIGRSPRPGPRRLSGGG